MSEMWERGEHPAQAEVHDRSYSDAAIDGRTDVEVVYEVTVYVPEDQPIPEEDVMMAAIAQRFPEASAVRVERM